MIIEEYENEKTKIRVHDDYINKDTEEQKKIKEIIISLLVNCISNSEIS